jgi:hypothetical protein
MAQAARHKPHATASPHPATRSGHYDGHAAGPRRQAAVSLRHYATTLQRHSPAACGPTHPAVPAAPPCGHPCRAAPPPPLPRRHVATRRSCTATSPRAQAAPQPRQSATLRRYATPRHGLRSTAHPRSLAACAAPLRHVARRARHVAAAPRRVDARPPRRTSCAATLATSLREPRRSRTFAGHADTSATPVTPPTPVTLVGRYDGTPVIIAPSGAAGSPRRTACIAPPRRHARHAATPPRQPRRSRRCAAHVALDWDGAGRGAATLRHTETTRSAAAGTLRCPIGRPITLPRAIRSPCWRETSRCGHGGDTDWGFR